MFNLRKNVKAVFFILVNISFIWILLFMMFIVGIYLVINGMPMILCFISVMWNVCLNGLVNFFLFHCSSGDKEKLSFLHDLLELILVMLLTYWLFS